MLALLLVEDNPNLAKAMQAGLEATGQVQIIHVTALGEEAVEWCLGRDSGGPNSGQSGGQGAQPPDAALMDVRLAGAMNGIQAAVALRREFPRLPIVFYSIQDDDQYYRDFRRAGILSHYAYVRKSNYLLPQMVLPLLFDAVAGRSLIDPEIAARVQEVRAQDEQDPLALLEPNEQAVVRLLAAGLTNEQIAERLGFRDKRTISRTNGQIYAAWGLGSSDTDEKVARTRAAIIATTRRLITWNEGGQAFVQTERGDWVEWQP
jgi:DNA-binding NarL/FixJ family response regulator